jgi:hypothetical protein
MPKKQLNSTEAAVVAASPAKARKPRITAAKHKPATVESPVSKPAVTHEAIAKVAYGYWESRGYEGGDALDDWFRAEAELKQIVVH